MSAFPAALPPRRLSERPRGSSGSTRPAERRAAQLAHRRGDGRRRGGRRSRDGRQILEKGDERAELWPSPRILSPAARLREAMRAALAVPLPQWRCVVGPSVFSSRYRRTMRRSSGRGAPVGTGSRIPSSATLVATVTSERPWKGIAAVSSSQHTTPKDQRSHLCE